MSCTLCCHFPLRSSCHRLGSMPAWSCHLSHGGRQRVWRFAVRVTLIFCSLTTIAGDQALWLTLPSSNQRHSSRCCQNCWHRTPHIRWRMLSIFIAVTVWAKYPAEPVPRNSIFRSAHFRSWPDISLTPVYDLVACLKSRTFCILGFDRQSLYLYQYRCRDPSLHKSWCDVW